MSECYRQIRREQASSVTVRYVCRAPGRVREDLSSEDRGFLDQVFGSEWEVVRQPAIDPAFERADPGNSFRYQQQRHPGAGRFVGSRAVEDDVPIPGNLSVSIFDLFHSYAKRAR